MGALMDALNALEQQARAAIADLRNLAQVQAVKVKFLGRKGLLTEVLRQMGALDAAERPEVGRRANTIKVFLEQELDKVSARCVDQGIARRLASQCDITLPGRTVRPGHAHPITTTLARVTAIFRGMGFAIHEGPEVETEYYNFTALNMPPHHPARDMQDTFYIEATQHAVRSTQNGLLLRTHTSPVQIHVMERSRPPIRMIAPGAVYRRDADTTHSPMFHQVEGLYVDARATMADLKGVLTAFVHQLFGDDCPIRFRPSFFPFTEPSAEVDIGCVFCRAPASAKSPVPEAHPPVMEAEPKQADRAKGKDCPVCKGTGWLEILGAGMVDPEVFRHVKYDPRKVHGFAFGMGIERIAMLKYGIDDIRLFYSGDLRFLGQF